MAIPKEDLEAVRQRILDAAELRFRQYGFGKTTMAEIAGDCGMSAANLYRYFDNKHDIGAAMACQCLAQKSDRLQAVVQDPDLAPADRIEHFILAALRSTYERCAEQPRISELVDAFMEKLRDLVEEHLGEMHVMLRAIIDEGVETGDFGVADSDAAADAVLTSMFMFDYPSLMHLGTLELFEEKARRVAGLLLRGLTRR